MRIALTGTPGVGKSTVATLLREAGEAVVDLNAWATEHDAITGEDADGTKVIDPDCIDVAQMPADCIIDSHLSHVLPVDMVWLIRCDPAVLRGRLEARSYSPAKVTENLEAEAMDLILQEALAQGVPVVQRDGTHRTPEALVTSFQQTKTEALKRHDLDDVDWSDRLLDGF